MFDPTKTMTTRLADAADLLIDFATLGEYGLEPVGRTRPGCAPPSPRKHPRSRPRTRAEERQASCTLLQEAGFRRPTTLTP